MSTSFSFNVLSVLFFSSIVCLSLLFLTSLCFFNSFEGFYARPVPSTDMLKKSVTASVFPTDHVIGNYSWGLIFGCLRTDFLKKRCILDFHPFLGTKMLAALDLQIPYLGVEIIYNHFTKFVSFCFLFFSCFCVY